MKLGRKGMSSLIEAQEIIHFTEFKVNKKLQRQLHLPHKLNNLTSSFQREQQMMKYITTILVGEISDQIEIMKAVFSRLSVQIQGPLTFKSLMRDIIEISHLQNVKDVHKKESANR